MLPWRELTYSMAWRSGLKNSGTTPSTMSVPKRIVIDVSDLKEDPCAGHATTAVVLDRTTLIIYEKLLPVTNGLFRESSETEYIRPGLTRLGSPCTAGQNLWSPAFHCCRQRACSTTRPRMCCMCPCPLQANRCSLLAARA